MISRYVMRFFIFLTSANGREVINLTINIMSERNATFLDRVSEQTMDFRDGYLLCGNHGLSELVKTMS